MKVRYFNERLAYKFNNVLAIIGYMYVYFSRIFDCFKIYELMRMELDDCPGVVREESSHANKYRELGRHKRNSLKLLFHTL